MERYTEIPYVSLSSNAFLPKLFREHQGKFIYNLYSPFNGVDIPRGYRLIKTNIEIIVPLGVFCCLKSIHYEEDGKYIKDYSYDKGIVVLGSGKQHSLDFEIPIGWSTLSLKRADLLGALIVDRIVNFKPFVVCGEINMILKYQRLSQFANKPIQNKGSAGMDLCSNGYYVLEPNCSLMINTDLALEIPRGCYARVAARSGISNDYSINVLGGVIDNNFRGSVFVTLINHGIRPFTINPGDKIAQMIIEKYEECLLVEAELTATGRGTNCLGSTGLNAQQTSDQGAISTQETSGENSFFQLFEIQ